MAIKLIREKVLPYGRQSIDEDDIRAVIEVLRSDYLTTGPKIVEFEKAFAACVGAKYAIAVANGTAALHAAAFAAGIQPGDEVITTPITFAASANCILYMGGKPVFADIKADTYNIDPQDISKKVTTKTKAIIPVDFSGQPVDEEEIQRIAKEHNLIVIEDAAHALGATYKSRKIGSLSAMTIFSFHPVKHITTGEGGMITTNNEDYYRKLILFRSHGITRDRNLLEQWEGDWYYEQQELGFNYRMTDFQAALGLSQLRKLTNFVKRRREIASCYNKAFQDLAGLIIPYQAPQTKSSWHLYVIQLDPDLIKVSRYEIYAALKALRFGINVHYIPVYYHPYYRRLGYSKGLCPIAEDYYEHALTLPLFPAMNDQDVNDVIEAVRSVIIENRK